MKFLLLVYLMIFLWGCKSSEINKDYYFQQGFNASTVVNLTNYVYIIKEIQKYEDVSVDIYIFLYCLLRKI